MNNKVILNLEGIALGELTFDGKVYTYHSYPENEIRATTYTLMLFYNLRNSNYLKSNTLFPIFAKFLDDCQREDIIKQANIKEIDGEFERLLKLASIPFAPYEFYVTKG